MGDDMANDANTLLIMGSVRAGRQCPAVAAWVAQIGLAETGVSAELIDLRQWLLPMEDEPAIPATGHYLHAHTHAWHDRVAAAGAIVIVTPQYNWGYPAALKNAIDHLYDEWRDKPAMLVTYGGHGGTKCAEQLRQVASAVKLQLVPTSPALVLPQPVIREGATVNPARDFESQRAIVAQAWRELRGLVAVAQSSAETP